MTWISLLVVALSIYYSAAIQRCSKIDSCRCSTDEGEINLWSLRTYDNKPRFNVTGSGNESRSSLAYLWSPCVPWTYKGASMHAKSAFKHCENVSVCRLEVLPDDIPLDRDIGEQELMDCVLTTKTSKPSCMLQYRVKSNPRLRSNIVLHCHTTQQQAVLDHFDSDFDHDIFNTTLHSQCACPGRCVVNPFNHSSPMSTGLILIIIFVCLALVYLIGGMMCNRLSKGARGKEMIPHLSFWMDFPYLVKDGIDYSALFCYSCGQSMRRPRRSYTVLI